MRLSVHFVTICHHLPLFPLPSLLSHSPPLKNGDGDDDANWSVDTSAEAVQARKEDLTGLVSTLTLDDSEKSPAERVNIFFKYVEVNSLCQGYIKANYKLVLCV